MSDLSKSNLLPYLALVVGMLTLGFSAIFVRWGNAPGAVNSLYRMLIAILLLAWPFYRRARKQWPLPKFGLHMAVLGGLFFAADLAAWSTGVVISGAANPTLLANTSPLWVGLGALLIFREKLPPGFWLGLLIAMSGAVLILGLDAFESMQFGIGSLLGLLSGLFYGAYFLFTQRGREQLDPISYFWVSGIVTALALLALTLVLRLPLSGYPPRTWLSFLAVGVVTQVIGYLAINYALGHLPASIVSPTLLGQPVVTAIAAGPLLGEWITPMEIVGGMAVLLGVFIIHRSRHKENLSQPAPNGVKTANIP